MLHLTVSAAPWVPVDEVRIIVNGVLVKKINGTALTHPQDPFGTGGLVRYQGDVALSQVLPPSGDAWLVVEAGWPLPIAGDFGGLPSGGPDGVPDTSDNNGDGKVTQADIAPGQTYGPLNDPAPPTDPSDPRYHFAQVVTNAYPFAFTNPFFFDRNGDGQFTPPRTVVPQPDGQVYPPGYQGGN
jgi:hypothetical protein